MDVCAVQFSPFEVAYDAQSSALTRHWACLLAGNQLFGDGLVA
jgi:hypothetical protein